jgi:hypothetical protein
MLPRGINQVLMFNAFVAIAFFQRGQYGKGHPGF